ncbi:RNA polymerase II transcription factor SIII subunit A-domain-containing protein [Xylaria arbuscula]|nr:RNA polymerase II transcription factor SIII subunit A-domain-containing protein [Xylaria arbuscula]
MVKSLVELCTAAAVKNIKKIGDVGSLPYSITRPILLKIDSAAQLRQIEINCPQLGEDTAELWKRLIARDFPMLSRRETFVPKNPLSWHKIYNKYQKMDAAAKRQAKERLQTAFKGIQQEKDLSRSEVITYDRRKLPGLPRDARGDIRANKPKRAGPDMSVLRFTGGSRTKVNTPKGLLKRAMREAKEISSRNRINSSSNGVIRVQPGQIAKAPVGMVQEEVKKARPLGGIRPPTRTLQSSARQRELDAREARLRKAKDMGSSQKVGSYISDEDLDDMDIEGEDDVFGGGLEVDDLEALGDEPSYEPAPAPSRSHSSSQASARSSLFGRKMGTSSRTRTETTTGSSRGLGQTSPPPRPAAPGSSSASSSAMMPRKRKATDIFMKPKPKVSRP